MLCVMASFFVAELVTCGTRALDKRPRVGLHDDLSPVTLNGREVPFCLKKAMVQRIRSHGFVYSSYFRLGFELGIMCQLHFGQLLV